MKTRFLVFAVAWGLSGCVRLDERGFDDVQFQRDLRQGAPIAIGSYTPFNWDHLYIYVPGSLRATIKQEVGTSVPYPHLDGGGYCLLVFTSGGKIAAAFEEARNRVDFARLYRNGGYSRDEATFKGSTAADGSYLLQFVHSRG